MKYLLTLIICSGVSGDCQPVKGYPIIKDDYPTCILDGMIESHKFVKKLLPTIKLKSLESFQILLYTTPYTTT